MSLSVSSLHQAARAEALRSRAAEDAPSHSQRPSFSVSKRNFAPKFGGATVGLSVVPRPAVAAPVAQTPRAELTVEDRIAASQEEKGEGKAFRVEEVDSAVQKDFNEANVLSSVQVAPGVRCITVDAQISREFIPLEKAYTKPGQTVRARRIGEEGEGERTLVSSAPFPGETNFGVLYKLRGDISAGSTKAAQFALSVHCPLDLHVLESQSSLYSLAPGDAVEIGPFDALGMDLRPIMFLSRFPTLLIFAAGPGIAVARALIEAQDVGSLYLGLRSDVRLYYAAPTPSQLAYKERHAVWESSRVQVKPVVEQGDSSWQGFTGSFSSAFDEDDLEYDPETTGAVVCGDSKSNLAALAVLDEAGIPPSSIVTWEH